MGRASPRCFISLTLSLTLLFAVEGAFATQPTELYPRRIELFTTRDIQMTGIQSLLSSPSRSKIELVSYELDGIQQFETQLSSHLPANPNRSKQIALKRIQQMDEQTMAAVQNAAVGLAKAMKYGVDRYPAIVFDGETVVYGLTDLNSALDYYQTWRTGVRP